MTVLEILQKVRKKLDRPEAWTQRLFARNKAGRQVNFDSRSAKCWCLTGAIRAVASGIEDFFPAENLLCAEAKVESLANWNDAPRRTHKQVLALLDRAIAKLQKGA